MMKKAQHEIMGFVLIVIIVSILGLIFLSLSIGRGEVKEKTSAELSHFLEASMYYTTNCTITHIPQYKDLKGLIKLCYRDSGLGRSCLNGNEVCDELNLTIMKIMKILDIDKDGKNKAYNLKMYFESNNTSINHFFNSSEGVFQNCSSVRGTSKPIQAVETGGDSGDIITELDVCQG